MSHPAGGDTPPRVSVVMPVFNGERYVAEAIQSVLASRYEHFELLVLHDDGCRDASEAVATRAASGDPRVRIMRHPHTTPAEARNIGLREARGELIANLDCDDAMLPDRLERQVAYLDRHPECVGVGSRALVVDQDGRPTGIVIRLFTHEEIDSAHLDGRGGALGNATAMFRRAAALAIGGYAADLRTTGEDHDLWLRMAEIGKLANLPEVLTRYRVHGENASIGDAKREQRLAVTIEILKRTFARRGITNRPPVKRPAPPLESWERWSDRALVQYFSGDRAAAVWSATLGWVLRPTAQASRAALRTVLTARPAGATPRRGAAQPIVAETAAP